METKQESKSPKTKSPQASTSPVRVKRETKRRLQTELAKVNRKNFGKKVKMDDLILLLLRRLTEQDIAVLQEQSLSNADRLEIAHRDYIKKNGSISKDAFIGIMLASTHVDKEPSAIGGDNSENSRK